MQININICGFPAGGRPKKSKKESSEEEEEDKEESDEDQPLNKKGKGAFPTVSVCSLTRFVISEKVEKPKYDTTFQFTICEIKFLLYQ